MEYPPHMLVATRIPSTTSHHRWITPDNWSDYPHFLGYNYASITVNGIES